MMADFTHYIEHMVEFPQSDDRDYLAKVASETEAKVRLLLADAAALNTTISPSKLTIEAVDHYEEGRRSQDPPCLPISDTREHHLIPLDDCRYERCVGRLV